MHQKDKIRQSTFNSLAPLIMFFSLLSSRFLFFFSLLNHPYLLFLSSFFRFLSPVLISLFLFKFPVFCFLSWLPSPPLPESVSCPLSLYQFFSLLLPLIPSSFSLFLPHSLPFSRLLPPVSFLPSPTSHVLLYKLPYLLQSHFIFYISSPVFRLSSLVSLVLCPCPFSSFSLLPPSPF